MKKLKNTLSQYKESEKKNPGSAPLSGSTPTFSLDVCSPTCHVSPLFVFRPLLADRGKCTCDPSTVLTQLMDLDPVFAFLLIDGHHIVVRTHCNLCTQMCAQKLVHVTTL